jgi:hypothetical protein
MAHTMTQNETIHSSRPSADSAPTAASALGIMDADAGVMAPGPNERVVALMSRQRR